jgi:hypothetical protein
MTIPREFTAMLAKYPAPVQEAAQQLRTVVMKAVPGCSETVDTSSNVIGYGLGPGYNGLICTIILSRGGVKLGIARSVDLPDPAGLLTGKGKVHRYVEFPDGSAMRNPAVAHLLQSAVAAWKRRTKVPAD